MKLAGNNGRYSARFARRYQLSDISYPWLGKIESIHFLEIVFGISEHLCYSIH